MKSEIINQKSPPPAARYRNREGQIWELDDVQPAEQVPLVMVTARRRSDGQRVTLARTDLLPP